MLMIILLHSIDHSGLLKNLTVDSALYYYEWFLYALVQVCVNCFVLISGYFLVNARFKPEKLVALWVETVFYSLAIKIVMMATGKIPCSLSSLASCFAPVFTGRYWFVTIYFGMYLLSPFFNIAIKAMNKKQHATLLGILFILSSVMVSIYPRFKGMNSGGAWGLAWFSVLYFTAAYFRCYYEAKGKSVKEWLVFFACPALMLLALWISQKLGYNRLGLAVKNLWKYNSVPAFTASIALFVAFLNCKKNFGKSSAWITRISKTTFGVYLIHAHANLCTEEMWRKIGMIKNINAWWFALYQLGVVLAIFVVCAIIDYVRQVLAEKFKINSFFKKLTVRLCGKCFTGKE